MVKQVEQLQQCLSFIEQAEQLKDTLRTAYTSKGKQESSAEHSWRLCLMAMVFEHEFGQVDFAKLLKICVLHDLGEAIHGDIAAIHQDAAAKNKAIAEREDFQQLIAILPTNLQQQFLSLWDEYEQGSSLEARIVKGLDKLETLIQHNQGKNPATIDFQFNLSYGQAYMANHPLLLALRQLIDQKTHTHIKP